MREIGAQHARHGLRRFFRRNVLIEFARDRGVLGETAANEDVIAVDRVALVVHIDARAEQANVADVMLRAGVMAAGQMDVDRRIHRRRGLAKCRDGVGVALGVGGGETAAEASRAGNEAGAKRRRLRRKTQRLDRGDGFRRRAHPARR